MDGLSIEGFLKVFASCVALGIEVIAVLCILIGVLRALPRILADATRMNELPTFSGHSYMRLGRWLLLGLEFALAADIVRTAITPTWTDIGMLGAIAVIRTFLNYFLFQDMERLRSRNDEGTANG